MTLSFDEASRLCGDALGDLPENVCKIIRAIPDAAPNSAYVSEWCRQHPKQVAIIVGVMARLQAQRLVAEGWER